MTMEDHWPEWLSTIISCIQGSYTVNIPIVAKIPTPYVYIQFCVQDRISCAIVDRVWKMICFVGSEDPPIDEAAKALVFTHFSTYKTRYFCSDSMQGGPEFFQRYTACSVLYALHCELPLSTVLLNEFGALGGELDEPNRQSWMFKIRQFGFNVADTPINSIEHILGCYFDIPYHSYTITTPLKLAQDVPELKANPINWPEIKARHPSFDDGMERSAQDLQVYVSLAFHLYTEYPHIFVTIFDQEDLDLQKNAVKQLQESEFSDGYELLAELTLAELTNLTRIIYLKYKIVEPIVGV